jgi:hypothetical protein
VDVNPPQSQLAFTAFRDEMKDVLRKLELFTLTQKLYGDLDTRENPKPVPKKEENNLRIQIRWDFLINRFPISKSKRNNYGS